jgi:hypothetical protein
MEPMLKSLPLNNYQKYIKPKLENDTCYRTKWNGYMNKYKKKRYDNDEEYKQNEYKKQREIKKHQYHNNEQYRIKKKDDALNRYYEKKALKFYVNLFE